MLLLLLVAAVGAAPSPYSLALKHETVVKSNATVQTEQLADTYGQCIDVTFLNAQLGFNALLGIDSGITWRQANTLQGVVDKIYFANQTGLELLCNARQQYAQTLGEQYPYCLNRYTLLNKGNTDFTNCMYYVHIYKHLEFMCSTAWDVFQYNRDCIGGVEMAPGTKANPNDYNKCFNAYGDSVNADPANFCLFTATFTQCIQKLFTSKCGAATGWAQCEMERVGFAYDCPNLVCTP